MSWKTAKGREILETIEESPGDLELSSIKFPGLQVHLNRNEASKGERILGVRLLLDGNDKHEFEYRMGQVKELAGRICSSPFSRQDAEVIYRKRWVPSVGFCLPITQFTKKQCNAIQVGFYQAMLPKMGLNRLIPKPIWFGPKKFHGKGLVDFAVHQHITHLERFVGHLWQDKELGNLMQLAMDNFQQIIGSQHHFFTLDPTVYSYGEKSYVQFIWEQNFSRSISMKINNPWVESIVRENDSFIMDGVVKRVQKPHVLKRINNVRLYLCVSQVSDITNAAGDKINFDILNGEPNHTSQLQWPRRRKPLPENIKLFKNVIISCFKSSFGLWPQNLGPIFPPPPTSQPATTINNFLSTLPSHYCSLLGDFQLTAHEVRTILNWLKTGTLYAGSDGSVDAGQGAHAFAFTDGTQRTTIIGGSAPTPGNHNKITSLRSELAGAIAILLILQAFETIYQEPFPPANIWIDNNKVLRQQ